MRELEYIEVRIEPSYSTTCGGGVIGTMNIRVRYNGTYLNVIENMWHSDSISVLDYCFDRAKIAIKEHINEQ